MNVDPSSTSHRMFLFVLTMLIAGIGQSVTSFAAEIDLSQAVIEIRDGERPAAEKMAAQMLSEEVERRSGIKWVLGTERSEGKPVIAITVRVEGKESRAIPAIKEDNSPETKPEGYRLVVEESATNAPTVWIIGADPRGAMYGAGHLLRLLQCTAGSITLPEAIDIATAPAYFIRGHQLGYRARANSWDAWDINQFEQYIRELVFFGINSIENIPFQDPRTNSMMKYSRDEMNMRMSEICAKYDLDYWVWTPAEIDLSNKELRAKELDMHEAFYRDCKRLNGVFFPGGDPGHNPPELVLPFLEDIAKRLLPIHPEARVWLSLQWFNEEQVSAIYKYIEEKKPEWLGGLGAGPSSPPIPETRTRLPKQYPYRLYPDITHNKLCQYPVPWWDQAYALTLGREAINPRPVQYAFIHNWFGPYSDGFISYSDGVHDDVNKTIWSALSWNPDADVRQILIEYARVYFHPDVAEEAADGILALEKNWQGPLAENGAVDGTLLLWQQLEKKAPQLADNWRWQMNLVRAYYDAYTRQRLLYETQLERDANAILAKAPESGANKAMNQAMEVLNRTVTAPCCPELKTCIEELCAALFESIALQTSVKRYQASSAERGAFLDFIDYPLNNRWWLEDQFAEIRKLSSEKERLARLHTIATWENPGPGSFYDDLGNTAQSPHMLRGNVNLTDLLAIRNPLPTHWWFDEGMSRLRLSWQCTMDWPVGVVYEGLDKDAGYVIRTNGYGKCLLRIDGERVTATTDGKELGEIREFPVPSESLKDGKITLTWDAPTDEGDLNWRQQSRIAEIWLIKQ